VWTPVPPVRVSTAVQVVFAPSVPALSPVRPQSVSASGPTSVSAPSPPSMETAAIAVSSEATVIVSSPPRPRTTSDWLGSAKRTSGPPVRLMRIATPLAFVMSVMVIASLPAVPRYVKTAGTCWVSVSMLEYAAPATTPALPVEACQPGARSSSLAARPTSVSKPRKRVVPTVPAPLPSMVQTVAVVGPWSVSAPSPAASVSKPVKPRPLSVPAPAPLSVHVAPPAGPARVSCAARPVSVSKPVKPRPATVPAPVPVTVHAGVVDRAEERVGPGAAGEGVELGEGEPGDGAGAGAGQRPRGAAGGAGEGVEPGAAGQRRDAGEGHGAGDLLGRAVGERAGEGDGDRAGARSADGPGHRLDDRADERPGAAGVERLDAVEREAVAAAGADRVEPPGRGGGQRGERVGAVAAEEGDRAGEPRIEREDREAVVAGAAVDDEAVAGLGELGADRADEQLEVQPEELVGRGGLAQDDGVVARRGDDREDLDRRQLDGLHARVGDAEEARRPVGGHRHDRRVEHVVRARGLERGDVVEVRVAELDLAGAGDGPDDPVARRAEDVAEDRAHDRLDVRQRQAAGEAAAGAGDRGGAPGPGDGGRAADDADRVVAVARVERERLGQRAAAQVDRQPVVDVEVGIGVRIGVRGDRLDDDAVEVREGAGRRDAVDGDREVGPDDLEDDLAGRELVERDRPDPVGDDVGREVREGRGERAGGRVDAGADELGRAVGREVDQLRGRRCRRPRGS
jgi:hypothetical protein